MSYSNGSQQRETDSVEPSAVEAVHRYEEEVALLTEEMWRTKRFFAHWITHWNNRATLEDSRGQGGKAAYFRR